VIEDGKRQELIVFEAVFGAVTTDIYLSGDSSYMSFEKLIPRSNDWICKILTA
jgi:hypothetical protein